MGVAAWAPFWGVVPLYAVAAILYAVAFFGDRRALARYASWALALAAIVQLIGLLIFGKLRGEWPPISPGESLATLACATAFIYLYVEQRSGARGLGVFASTLILTFQLPAAYLGPTFEIPQILQGKSFGPHVAFNITSFASFTVGAFIAVTYLLQYRQLRSLAPGALMERLPSLEKLDDMSFRASQAGWIFLSIGLVLGAQLAHQVWGKAWQWDPKQCMTLLTWMIYGLALYLRRFRYWQGGRLAAITLAGFASILIALIVFHGLIPTEHQFN